jgi:4-alpha-glucanotransferase
VKRHAGVIVPLFSVTSTRSWGIGELLDLAPLSTWLVAAGFDRLMLLPTGPLAGDDTSPYSAFSAMAIDPIYIGIDDVPEFERSGGVAGLGDDTRADLEAARESASVAYQRVRRVKTAALQRAFDHFFSEEWAQLTLRASELAGYISRERWWLDDHALYLAIAHATGVMDWRHWPAPLRDRESAAMDEARRNLSREVLRHQYLQWIAETQWQRARVQVHAAGITLFGDLPFMVSGAGPEVWARPDEVAFDVRLGVPPDAFSDTGQDWGLPTYRWDRIAETDYAWMRQRARRMAALYDGYRVDHLVGLYRTYGRPPVGEPFFSPVGEAAQRTQGETLLGILRDTGAAIIAEDLGVVPDFVKESLARLGVPGCKVLRWERDWHADGHPFIDPAAYPTRSAALTGTHDTETLAGWWTNAGGEERVALTRLLSASLPDVSFDSAAPWSDSLRDAILAVLYRSASEELFFPIQDLFGWFHRINVPATVGEHNWTWRIPWRVDQLDDNEVATERKETLAALGKKWGRAATSR